MRDLDTKFGNDDYQQQLAVALASAQGIEAAIRSCQEFGWDGVLDCLLNARDSESSNADTTSSVSRKI